MSGSTHPIPFSMPMFRGFVPERIRPWIYVFFAITFQFSGGLYLGTLNQMMGETTLMREDLLMCLYANLAGMAIYFPLLFRMKFRFTNKTLLCASATGVLLCNLLAPHITFLPLLWLVCFIEGMCKIQGTFECMSNIQLWMSPTRDFTVFFPVLHIVILGSMQLSDLLATYLMYYYHWDYMQLFISGIMMIDLLVLTVCTRHFRMFKKLPLFGIDWLGAILWAMLLLETAYLFNYGDWYDWWNSPVIRQLSVVIFVTFFFCVWRMFTIRHPYYACIYLDYFSRNVFRSRARIGGSLPGRSNALWRNDKRTTGLACACRRFDRMHIRLLVDAHQAFQLSSADNRRLGWDRMLFVGKLSLNLYRHPYIPTLSADILSQLCLCRA